MPTHVAHMMTNKMATGGDKMEFVNAWIDQPWAYLKGNHRVARHTLFEFYAHFSKPDGSIDPKLLNAGIMHLLTDEAGSADPALRLLLDLAGNMAIRPDNLEAFNNAYLAMMLRLL